MRARPWFALVALVSIVGCKKCGKTPPPEDKPLDSIEWHLAVKGCENNTRAYAVSDATLIAYDRLRFGVVTPDGLDTTVEAGFMEAAGKVPYREEIREMSGRLDDLWLVLRAVPIGSETDYVHVDRLVHRRNGKWKAIAPIDRYVRYNPPVLYRGGALSEAFVGDPHPRRRLVGFDLPPGVDAEALFPADAGTPIGLDLGEVAAPGISCVYVLAPDGRRVRLEVPAQGGGSRGEVALSGHSRGTLRAQVDDRVYKLDVHGEKFVLDEILDAGEAKRGRSWRYTSGPDGETFENGSDGRSVRRERKPAKVFECTPEPTLPQK